MSPFGSKSPSTGASALTQDDRRALHDLVRFGAMTREQLARRYTTYARSTVERHLSRLQHDGYLQRRQVELPGVQVLSPTALTRRAVRLPLQGKRPSENLLRHTLACVDMADWLLREHPGAEYRTELELMGRGAGFVRLGHARSHRPDGLLLTDGRRIAIEVELHHKDDFDYVEIGRWFAAQPRLDEVRWYVRELFLLDRIPELLNAYRLGADVGVHVFPLPDCVQVWP